MNRCIATLVFLSGALFGGALFAEDDLRRDSPSGLEQAKSLYDSTAEYRKSGLVRHLADARKLAEAVMRRQAATASVDSCAMATAAAALAELSQYVGAEDRARCREFVAGLLRRLSEKTCRPAGEKCEAMLGEARRRMDDIAARDAALAQLRETLPARPGLPGADVAGWAVLARRPDAAKIVAAAEGLLDKPLPDTPDELYLEFWKNGNRSHYQTPYFARARLLVTLVVAEALERKGRFMPKTVETIDAICAMKSWVLPAHDRTDGGRGNFKGTALSVDLFSSQIASHLAYAVNFIGDAMPPETVGKIRREAERRIFAPLRLSFSLMDDKGGFSENADPLRHWWTCGRNNWNSVCYDNVVTAALALLDDPTDRAFFVSRALRGLGYYARGGFAADGYCSEGMGYWNYGYGHLLMLGLVLRDLTDGRIDIFTEPIYRKAAEYAYSYQLERGVSPAFADGNGAPSAANLALVRRVWPDLTCRSAEAVSPFGVFAGNEAKRTPTQSNLLRCRCRRSSRVTWISRSRSTHSRR